MAEGGEGAGALNRFVIGIAVEGLEQLERVEATLARIQAKTAQPVATQVAVGGPAVAAGAAGSGGTVRPPRTGAQQPPEQRPPALYSGFATVARRVFMWGTSIAIIYGMVRAFNRMIEATKDLESEMTNLRKVMPSDTDFANLEHGFWSLSQTYGRSMSDVVRVGRLFAQTGMDERRVLEATRTAMLGMNAANMEALQSVEFLISATRIYNVEMERSSLLIDKIMRVQARFPIEAKELAEALQGAGSIFRALGETPDVLFGYVTAIKEVTRQSASTIYRSLRTILARMMRSEVRQTLRAFGVETETEGGFRRPSEILGEIARLYQQGRIGRGQLFQIGVRVAGIRRAEQFMALIMNYQTALKAIAESENAYGAAMRAQRQEMQTLARQIEVTRNIWREWGIEAVKSGPIPGLRLSLRLLQEIGREATRFQRTEAGRLITSGLFAAAGYVAARNFFSLMSRGKWAGLGGPATVLIAELSTLMTLLDDVTRYFRRNRVELSRTIDITSLATREYMRLFGSISDGDAVMDRWVELVKRSQQEGWDSARLFGEMTKAVNDYAAAVGRAELRVGSLAELHDKFEAGLRFLIYERYKNLIEVQDHLYQRAAQLRAEAVKQIQSEVKGSKVSELFSVDMKELGRPIGPEGYVEPLSRMMEAMAQAERTGGIFARTLRAMAEAEAKVRGQKLGEYLREITRKEPDLRGWELFLKLLDESAARAKVLKQTLDPVREAAKEVIKQELTERTNIFDVIALSGSTRAKRGIERAKAEFFKLVDEVVADLYKRVTGRLLPDQVKQALQRVLNSMKEGVKGLPQEMSEFLLIADRVRDVFGEIAIQGWEGVRTIEALRQAYAQAGQTFDALKRRYEALLEVRAKFLTEPIAIQADIRRIESEMEILRRFDPTKSIAETLDRMTEEQRQAIARTAHNVISIWEEWRQGLRTETPTIGEILEEDTRKLAASREELKQFRRTALASEQAVRALADVLDMPVAKIRAMLQVAGGLQEIIGQLSERLRDLGRALEARDVMRAQFEAYQQRLEAWMNAVRQFADVRTIETPRAPLERLKESLAVLQSYTRAQMAIVEAKKEAWLYDDQEGRMLDDLVRADKLRVSLNSEMLKTQWMIEESLNAQRRYTQWINENLDEAGRTLTDVLSDMEGWQRAFMGQARGIERPLARLAAGLGENFGRNVASRISDYLLKTRKSFTDLIPTGEQLGSILGGGNLGLKTAADIGRGIIATAKTEVLLKGSPYERSMLDVNQRQLDVLRLIYEAVSGKQLPTTPGGAPVPLPGEMGILGRITPEKLATGEENIRKRETQQLYRDLMAQGSMMLFSYLGARMAERRGRSAELVAPFTQFGAMIGSATPLGPVAGSAVGSFLGSILGVAFGPKVDQTAEDIRQIRENTAVLKDIADKMINVPTTFVLPPTQGFYEGASRGAPITVNVYGQNPDDVVQAIEDAYGRTSQRSATVVTGFEG